MYLKWKRTPSHSRLSRAILGTIAFATSGGSAFAADLSLEDIMNLNVVTATKKAERLDEVPATMAVITERQIQEHGYVYLDQVLRDLPGFDLQNVQGEWPVQWTQRGLYGDENKRTILMVDGLVENNLFEGSVLGGPQYSLQNVARIEVLWGPASALYGANAFGGIIHIITKDGKDINGVKFTQGYGSFNTRYTQATLGGEKNGLEYSLSGSLYNSDGPTFPDWHPRYMNSFVHNAYSVNAKLAYEAVKLQYTRFDRPMGEGLFSNTPAAYGLPKYGYNGSEGGADGAIGVVSIDGDVPSQWHAYTQTARLSREFKLRENLSITPKAYWRNTGIASDSRELTWDTTAKRWDDAYYTHDSQLWGAEVQADYEILKDLSLIGGLQYEFSKVERSYRATSGTATYDPYADPSTGYGTMKVGSADDGQFVYYRNTSLYAQAQYKLKFLHYTGLTAGARFDSNSVFGSVFNPRVGVVSKFTESLGIKLLYGTAYRAPTNFELFSETSKRVAASDLKPERLTSFEVGLTHNPLNTFRYELSAFINTYRDLITSNVPLADGSGKNQNENVGTANVKGLQLAFHVLPLDWFTLGGNLTYQYGTKDEGNGAAAYEVPNVSRWKGNLNFDFILAKWLAWNWRVNLVGPRSLATTNPMGGSLAGYTLFGTGFTADHLFGDHFSASFIVDNLFDRQYSDPGIRGASGGYYPTHIPQVGRTGMIRVSANF